MPQTRPSFYDPSRIGTLFTPNLRRAKEEGHASGMKRVGKHRGGLCVVGIDWNRDFMDDGALPVTGGYKAVRNFTDDVIELAPDIDEFVLSFDMHPPYSIHDPSWWVDLNGGHPNPDPVVAFVTNDDVKAKKWRPLYMGDWSRQYAATVGMIPIWAPHCRVNTVGSALEPVLSEVVEWVCAARGIQPRYILKGTAEGTDWFGAFEAVVPIPDDPRTHLNADMLDVIGTHRKILWGGLAWDYCVKNSVAQYYKYFGDKPDVLAKSEFILDWTAAIHSDESNDFNRTQMAALRAFMVEKRKQGMHITQGKRTANRM